MWSIPRSAARAAALNPAGPDPITASLNAPTVRLPEVGLKSHRARAEAGAAPML